MKKLKEKYDEEILSSFFDHFGSSTMYRQILEDKEYITRYWGDNLDYNDMYHVVQYCYKPEIDNFEKSGWNYGSYEGDYFMKLHKEQRKTFYEMIQFLENECSLTSWEVWT